MKTVIRVQSMICVTNMATMMLIVTIETGGDDFQWLLKMLAKMGTLIRTMGTLMRTIREAIV